MPVHVYLNDGKQVDISRADSVEAERWDLVDGTISPVTPGVAVLACYAGNQVVARFRIDQIAGYHISGPIGRPIRANHQFAVSPSAQPELP